MLTAEIIEGGRFFRRKRHLLIAGKRVITLPKGDNGQTFKVAVLAADEMRAALGSAVEPLISTLDGSDELKSEIMELFQ